MDSASESKLSFVQPELARRVRLMAATLASRGVVIKVVSAKRSTAQQQRLYANRASNKYPVAVPGTSKHERGMAVDVARVTPAAWSIIGQAGKQAGLRWGGDFSRSDPVHFELPSAGQSLGVTLGENQFAPPPVLLMGGALFVILLLALASNKSA